jgi:Fe-S cluster assembly iron-binding protein IscA
MYKIIADDHNSNFEKALKTIETKKEIQIHKALKNAFNKFYEYTAKIGGVRHGSVNEDDINFETAKLLLVISSAFVNYLSIKGHVTDYTEKIEENKEELIRTTYEAEVGFEDDLYFADKDLSEFDEEFD